MVQEKSLNDSLIMRSLLRNNVRTKKDTNGNSIKGLLNSLSSALGAGSFDDANKDEFSTAFHASNLSFASDHLSLIYFSRIDTLNLTQHFV